jgi:hypothetical protein
LCSSQYCRREHVYRTRTCVAACDDCKEDAVQWRRIKHKLLDFYEMAKFVSSWIWLDQRNRNDLVTEYRTVVPYRTIQMNRKKIMPIPSFSKITRHSCLKIQGKEEKLLATRETRARLEITTYSLVRLFFLLLLLILLFTVYFKILCEMCVKKTKS